MYSPDINGCMISETSWWSWKWWAGVIWLIRLQVKTRNEQPNNIKPNYSCGWKLEKILQVQNFRGSYTCWHISQTMLFFSLHHLWMHFLWAYCKRHGI